MFSIAVLFLIRVLQRKESTTRASHIILLQQPQVDLDLHPLPLRLPSNLSAKEGLTRGRVFGWKHCLRGQTMRITSRSMEMCYNRCINDHASGVSSSARMAYHTGPCSHKADLGSYSSAYSRLSKLVLDILHFPRRSPVTTLVILHLAVKKRLDAKP